MIASDFYIPACFLPAGALKLTQNAFKARFPEYIQEYQAGSID